MITHADIFDKVRTWIVDNVAAEVGDKVIEANQNAPRPARPYISVLVTTTTQKEHSNESHPGDTGMASIENELSCMVSVQCIGENAKTIMGNLRQTLEKPTVLQSLRAAGLPFIRVLSGVNDLTEQTGTQYEERAGVDIEFRAAAVVIDEVGVIESVEGAATHERPGGESTTLNYSIGAS